jgi:hypothetical protein
MKPSTRTLSLVIASTIFLYSCRNTQSTQAAETQPSQSELIDGYRQAHDRRDLQAMLKLFCWDGVTPELRQMTEDGVKGMFEEKILRIKIADEHPKGRMNQYIRNGVTYGLNLPVVKELVLQTASSSPNVTPGSSYYPVGIKDGHYVIAVMAPVPNTGAKSPEDSLVPHSESAEPPVIVNAGQQVIVPAKTPLTVRLKQVVGVKLIDSGGIFAAILSDPVQVSGVTAVPAGAIVQGIVTRHTNYSPEMTLTSVAVNGKSYPLRTVSISFNEQISYPLGSELSFELVSPLHLTQ